LEYTLTEASVKLNSISSKNCISNLLPHKSPLSACSPSKLNMVKEQIYISYSSVWTHQSQTQLFLFPSSVLVTRREQLIPKQRPSNPEHPSRDHLLPPWRSVLASLWSGYSFQSSFVLSLQLYRKESVLAHLLSFIRIPAGADIRHP